MDYELAKELKDAGFPQEQIRRWDASTFQDNIYCPTLAELIEACGKDFYALMRPTRYVGWEAIPPHGDDPPAEGSTPEEAVAKLWLALHTSHN